MSDPVDKLTDKSTSHPLDSALTEYQAQVDRVNARFPERRADFTTGSGDHIQRLYTPKDVETNHPGHDWKRVIRAMGRNNSSGP